MQCWIADQSVGPTEMSICSHLSPEDENRLGIRHFAPFSRIILITSATSHLQNTRNECRLLVFVTSSGYRPSVACVRFLPWYFFVLSSERNQYLNKRYLIINYFHWSLPLNIGIGKWLWWLGQALDHPEIGVRCPAEAQLFIFSTVSRGQNSSYWLNGPRIEPAWGKIFRNRSYLPWGLPSLLYNSY
jgi:hypothetical protein